MDPFPGFVQGIQVVVTHVRLGIVHLDHNVVTPKHFPANGGQNFLDYQLLERICVDSTIDLINISFLVVFGFPLATFFAVHLQIPILPSK